MQEIFTAKQALIKHEASVVAYNKRESERLAQEKKESLIPRGVIVDDNGISVEVLEHLATAEQLSRINGRHMDESRIHKLIKELILS